MTDLSTPLSYSTNPPMPFFNASNVEGWPAPGAVIAYAAQANGKRGLVVATVLRTELDGSLVVEPIRATMGQISKRARTLASVANVIVLRS